MKNIVPVLITVTVLIMLIIAVYVVGRVQGKNRGKRGQAELPNNGQGIPDGWNPADLSGRLYKALKGANFAWNPFSYDDRDMVLNELLNLATDDMFAAVHNHFLANYGKGKESLLDWISDEWNVADNILEGLMNRFSRLQLVS